METISNNKNSNVSGNTQTTALTQEQIAKNKKLKKTCAEFESVLTSYLFKTMRNSIPAISSVNQFTGKDTYTMLMDQKVAEELSKKGEGLGIQKIMYNQLVKKLNKTGTK